MTAQERAKELVEKFYNISLTRSKITASKVVDEIVNAIDWHEFETPNKELEFWQEVQQEIENIESL